MCHRSRFLQMPLQQLRTINSLQHLPTLTRIKCKSLGLIKRRQLWLMKVNLIWLTRTCHGQPTLPTHRCLYQSHLQSSRCFHCFEMGHTHPLWSSMECISSNRSWFVSIQARYQCSQLISHYTLSPRKSSGHGQMSVGKDDNIMLYWWEVCT